VQVEGDIGRESRFEEVSTKIEGRIKGSAEKKRPEAIRGREDLRPWGGRRRGVCVGGRRALQLG